MAGIETNKAGLVVAANRFRSGKGEQKEQAMEELLAEIQKAIPTVGVEDIAQIIDGNQGESKMKEKNEKKNEENILGRYYVLTPYTRKLEREELLRQRQIAEREGKEKTKDK